MYYGQRYAAKDLFSAEYQKQEVNRGKRKQFDLVDYFVMFLLKHLIKVFAIGLIISMLWMAKIMITTDDKLDKYEKKL